MKMQRLPTVILLQPVSNVVRNNATKVDGGVDVVVKNSAAARTPVFKMSTTRRQRRSNKRSGGQRLPSSNYLMHMGQSKGDGEELEDDQNTQENLAGGQREMLDPMLREGRRSGRKKPSNVGLDSEGFEDPSQFLSRRQHLGLVAGYRLMLKVRQADTLTQKGMFPLIRAWSEGSHRPPDAWCCCEGRWRDKASRLVFKMTTRVVTEATRIFPMRTVHWIDLLLWKK